MGNGSASACFSPSHHLGLAERPDHSRELLSNCKKRTQDVLFAKLGNATKLKALAQLSPHVS